MALNYVPIAVRIAQELGDEIATAPDDITDVRARYIAGAPAWDILQPLKSEYGNAARAAAEEIVQQVRTANVDLPWDRLIYDGAGTPEQRCKRIVREYMKAVLT